MVICIKNLLLLLLMTVFGVLSAADSFTEPRIINADGNDLVFRELLIEKSMTADDFKCVVTQDSFDNALKKLKSDQCDMILVKSIPESLAAEKDISSKVFATTPILVFVNRSNKISKMKLSDLRQIWNGDINQWNFFNKSNIFSIHRFAMPFDDSTFLFIKRTLPLKENTQHFPLDTAAQIIRMVSANPNAIGMCVFEKDLNFENINLIRMTDEKGRNVDFNMRHTVIFRSKDKNKVENFLKVKKR